MLSRLETTNSQKRFVREHPHRVCYDPIVSFVFPACVLNCLFARTPVLSLLLQVAMHENAIGPILAIAAGAAEDLEAIKQAVFAIGSFAEVEEVTTCLFWPNLASAVADTS